MRRWRPDGSAALVVGCLALVLAAGCGKRGAPVAPEQRVPAPATALTAAVEGPAITLTWVNPTRRVDGAPLRDLDTVRVFRRAEEPDAPLKPAMLSRGRVLGYEQIAVIRLAAPAPATVEGGVVRLTDRGDLVAGRRYAYVVTAVDGTRRSSGPSPRAAVTFLAAPHPPRDLAAEPDDSRVRLSWRPPEAWLDGHPAAGPLGYLVLRGAGEGALVPITPEPIGATSFVDPGVVNDADYRYAVAAVRMDPAGTARGEATPAIAVSPARTTPPGAPTGLVAIPTPRSVRLAWNEVPDPEVALYAVYRAEGAGAFSRVGTTPAGSTVYVDRDVEPGRPYRYAVTAVDRARRPNESPHSGVVAVVVE